MFVQPSGQTFFVWRCRSRISRKRPREQIFTSSKKGLSDSGCCLKEIDAIAYTKGPGLRGPLMVGASFAKSLGFALNKPVIPVHHMEAHLLMAKYDAPNLILSFFLLY